MFNTKKRKHGHRPRSRAWIIVILAVSGIALLVAGLVLSQQPQSLPSSWMTQTVFTLHGVGDYRFDLNTQRLTRIEANTRSPDDQWIASLVDSGGMDYSRFLILTPTSKPDTPRKLGHFYGARANVSWSPDSQWLALSAYSSPNGRWRPQKLNIQLLNITTGQLKPLVTNLDRDDFPLFSPDGKDLAYRHKEHLWVVNLRTRNVRPLPLEEPVMAFGWSDDGQFLVALVAPNTGPWEKADVWLIRTDGTGVQYRLPSVFESEG